MINHLGKGHLWGNDYFLPKIMTLPFFVKATTYEENSLMEIHSVDFPIFFVVKLFSKRVYK